METKLKKKTLKIVKFTRAVGSWLSEAKVRQKKNTNKRTIIT